MEKNNDETSELIIDEELSHQELVELTRSTVNEILKKEPVLGDLPTDVTLEEIEAQIAVIHGQSITLFVERGDETLPVVIKQKDSRVSDLKSSFRRALELKLKRANEKYKISWKHVWRVNWLSCDGVILESDHSFLADYGVVNKSRITFVPKLRKN